MLKYLQLKMIPDKATIEAAHQCIAPFIHKTPILTSESINQIAGAELFFKCENFQKIGAFKIRGATNAVLSLTDEEKSAGVATHSSGNHAQAMALAAKRQHTKAYIVMPKTAPEVKRKAVLGYGAEIIDCEPTLQAREEMLQAVIEKTQAHFIHPYNDYRVIAGQATCAKELVEEISGLDAVITPVGGGGLLSGTCLSSHYFSVATEVFAGEPQGADDAFRSLKAGKIIPSENPKTVADGLLTSLGDKTFPIIKNHVKEIIPVSDDEIINAMRLIWERLKIVVEASGAVPLAAILKRKEIFSGKKVGVILSGGNVDLMNLPFNTL